MSTDTNFASGTASCTASAIMQWDESRLVDAVMMSSLTSTPTLGADGSRRYLFCTVIISSFAAILTTVVRKSKSGIDESARGGLRFPLMAKTEKASGNPAHARMGNAHKKDYRTQCYRRGEKRKEQRVTLQEQQHRANGILLHDGKLTPWQQACAERAERRAAAGLREKWLKSQKDEQLPAG